MSVAAMVRERQREYAIGDLQLGANPWSPNIAPQHARAILEAVLAEARTLSDFGEITAFKHAISMLHRDVLIIMRWLAAATPGAVLEIGPYIGGSTTMFGKGVTLPRPLVVVEPGGAAPTHPHIPSDDILGDLEATLALCDVRDRVTLVKRASWDPQSVEDVRAALGGVPVTVFSIDADGHVDRDMELYRSLCAPGCVVVIDDYLDDENDKGRKALSIKPWVMDQVERGALIPFGVFGWSTWIGRLPA
jgi:cephalosporin hydroxylase